jgi:hypothetical protein
MTTSTLSTFSLPYDSSPSLPAIARPRVFTPWNAILDTLCVLGRAPAAIYLPILAGFGGLLGGSMLIGCIESIGGALGASSWIGPVLRFLMTCVASAVSTCLSTRGVLSAVRGQRTSFWSWFDAKTIACLSVLNLASFGCSLALSTGGAWLGARGLQDAASAEGIDVATFGHMAKWVAVAGGISGLLQLAYAVVFAFVPAVLAEENQTFLESIRHAVRLARGSIARLLVTFTLGAAIAILATAFSFGFLAIVAAPIFLALPTVAYAQRKAEVTR